MKKLMIAALVALTSLSALGAEHYQIDTRHAHAFVQFRISHMGFSWLYGRFNDFDGQFVFDPESPENSSASVVIEAASVDTNNAARDDHLRSDDFLDVSNHPQARFQSTAFEARDDGSFLLTGDFTLRGVTRAIEIEVEEVGAGEDPWGGFRRGFSGTTTLKLADYGIDFDLGPAATEVEITLSMEGVRREATEDEA
ncbi:MAG TPA: YceI family protein [Wenzhouxiangella sp.]|nr:YceI family protein [Wenzhouxiangella sp.]